MNLFIDTVLDYFEPFSTIAFIAGGLAIIYFAYRGYQNS